MYMTVMATIAGAPTMNQKAGPIPPLPLTPAAAAAAGEPGSPALTAGTPSSDPLPCRAMASRQTTKTPYVTASSASTNGASSRDCRETAPSWMVRVGQPAGLGWYTSP